MQFLRRRGEEGRKTRTYAYIREKKAGHRGRGGLHERAGLFACSPMASQGELMCKRSSRKKKQAKSLLLYPKAPLGIKCLYNEFGVTIVESNDAVQKPGSGSET